MEMIDHRAAELLILDYLEGDLDEQTRQSFEAHAVGCSLCRDELQTLQRGLVLAQKAPFHSAPAGLVERTLDRIAQPAVELAEVDHSASGVHDRGGWKRAAPWFAAAATAVIAIGLVNRQANGPTLERAPASGATTIDAAHPVEEGRTTAPSVAPPPQNESEAADEALPAMDGDRAQTERPIRRDPLGASGAAKRERLLRENPQTERVLSKGASSKQHLANDAADVPVPGAPTATVGAYATEGSVAGIESSTSEYQKLLSAYEAASDADSRALLALAIGRYFRGRRDLQSATLWFRRALDSERTREEATSELQAISEL